MRPTRRLESITAFIWAAKAGFVRCGMDMMGFVSGGTLISKDVVIKWPRFVLEVVNESVHSSRTDSRESKTVEVHAGSCRSKWMCRMW